VCRLVEGELEFGFTGAVSVRKFDGDDHRLTHCMKAVDFIIEFKGKYLFVEVKDPQDSGAIENCRRSWIKTFTSGTLDHNLKYKYRDSFLYEWGEGRAEKPIVYVVLIALDTLDSPLMLSRQDQLRRILPISGPGSRSWVRPIADGCVVLNIESWNRRFQGCPIRRRVPSVTGEQFS